MCVCVWVNICVEGKGDGRTGTNSPVRGVQEGRTQPHTFSSTQVSPDSLRSFHSSLRAGPQPTCPGVSCRCLAVPSAVAIPEVLYLWEAPLCLSAQLSSLPVIPAPSLGCRMPCVQLWFPGNKTTIKVSGTAGDLHHILSCMDSIFNTQY